VSRSANRNDVDEAVTIQVSSSEVFDGDAPHAPGGAIAQAWSVGEILRVAVRTGWRPALDRR